MKISIASKEGNKEHLVDAIGVALQGIVEEQGFTEAEFIANMDTLCEVVAEIAGLYYLGLVEDVILFSTEEALKPLHDTICGED